MNNHDSLLRDGAPLCAFIHDAGAEGVVHIFGEIDLSNAAEFESELREAAARQRSIVINLSACNYMDSSGLRVLLRLHADLGDRLRIVLPPTGGVRRVFTVAGLDRLLQLREVL